MFTVRAIIVNPTQQVDLLTLFASAVKCGKLGRVTKQRCSARILAIKFDSCQLFNVLIYCEVINLGHFPYLGS